MIVVADILQEVISDGILDIVVMLTLSNNPWNVGVGWGESFSGLSNSVFKSDGVITFVAGKDVSDVVDFSSGGAGVGNLFVVGSLV